MVKTTHKPKKSNKRRIFSLILLQFLIFATLSGITYNNSATTISSVAQVDWKTVIQAENDCSLPVQQWNRTWGGPVREFGHDVAIDKDNNTYVAGRTLSFGVGGVDALVIKYSPSGNQLWNRTFGTTGNDGGGGIAIDSDNNVYLCGYIDETYGSSYDALIVKYNAVGNRIWNISWGRPSYYDEATDIAIDSESNVIIGGIANFVVLDNQMFIAKFNSTSGKEIWNATYGISSEEQGYGITVDNADNIYIAGERAAGVLAIVVKYNSSGDLQWAKEFDWVSYEWGMAVVADDSGNVYFTGYSQSFLFGDKDVFLLKLNSTGGVLWLRLWSMPKDEYVYDIKREGTNLYLTGYTTSLSTGATRDIFLVKYDLDGNQPWSLFWNKSLYENGESLAVKGSDIYIVGYIGSSFSDCKVNLIKYAFIPPKQPDTSSIPGFQLFFVLAAFCSIIIVIKKLNRPTTFSNKAI